MGLNRQQQIALAITPKISSIFSLVGSSWIAIEVLTHNGKKPKRRHSYHRLLLAMSIYDILESIWNFMSTWPIPKGEGGGIWSVGNTQTCSAQGFFLTLSVAVPIYNAFLAVYYMLVINFQCTERTLQRKVEPAMHIVSFVWAFGTAFTSVMMGLINDANLWCWIAPFPKGCLDSWRYGDEAPCERGDNAWIYRWAFYFAPLWLCIFVATAATLAVFFKVRNLDKITLKYRRPASSASLFYDKKSSSNVESSAVMDSTAMAVAKNETGLVDGETSKDAPMEQKTSSKKSRRAGGKKKRENRQLAEEEEKDDDFLAGTRPEIPRQRSVMFNIQQKRQNFQQNNPRSAQVLNQAIWYLGTFYLTHLWSTSNRINQMIHPGRVSFGLTFVHSWFDPFQGFLNFLVYQRPRYLHIRNISPELGRLGACYRAMRFSYRVEGEGGSASLFSKRSLARKSSACSDNFKPTLSKSSISLGREESAREPSTVGPDIVGEVESGSRPSRDSIESGSEEEKKSDDSSVPD